TAGGRGAGVRGGRPLGARRARGGRAPDRPQHDARDGRVRPDPRARPGAHARRGSARGDPRQPRRDGGVPRRGAGRRGMTAALELDELEIRYGAVAAVRRLSLEVGHGEIVGLVGPNGAGKATTPNAIMGLVPVHGGEIRLAGASIRGRRTEALVRSGGAFVSQGGRVYAN